MKKLKRLFSLEGLTLLALSIPSVAHAAADWEQLLPTNPFALQDLDVVIRQVVQILLILAGVVGLVYLIIGGYQYVTAGGNAETAAAARTTILNAVIGLIIIFASYAILTWVMGEFL